MHRQSKHNNQRISLLFSFLLLQVLPCCILRVNAQQDKIRNICAYLGGRADKNFLGSGNVALVIEPDKTKLLFSPLLVGRKEKHAVVWCCHQQHKIQDSVLATVVGQKTQQRRHSKQARKFFLSGWCPLQPK